MEGVVTAVSTSRNGNTFINFGRVYPNQTFTGWIPAGTPLANDTSISALLPNPDVDKVNFELRIVFHTRPSLSGGQRLGSS